MGSCLLASSSVAWRSSAALMPPSAGAGCSRRPRGRCFARCSIVAIGGLREIASGSLDAGCVVRLVAQLGARPRTSDGFHGIYLVTHRDETRSRIPVVDHRLAAVSRNSSCADGRTSHHGRGLAVRICSAGSVGPWTAVNDTLMGGVSRATCRATDAGTLKFAGEVSPQNSGSSASVRARTDTWDLSASDERGLRVRGDGKRYASSVQIDSQIMAGAHYLDFQTEKGQWQGVRPTTRILAGRAFGQRRGEAPTPNVRDVHLPGSIISNEQAGPVDRDKARMVAALFRQAIARGVPRDNAGQPDACAAASELTARCKVDLPAADPPAETLDLLRAGLANAERSTNPVGRAWALREAFEASLPILRRDSGAAEHSDGYHG